LASRKTRPKEKKRPWEDYSALKKAVPGRAGTVLAPRGKGWETEVLRQRRRWVFRTPGKPRRKSQLKRSKGERKKLESQELREITGGNCH